MRSLYLASIYGLFLVQMAQAKVNSPSNWSAKKSFFQITFETGYFKNGFSLVESTDKNTHKTTDKSLGDIYTLNRMTNNKVQSIQILTEKTHSQMKSDFIKFTEALKLSNKNRKIASCLQMVSIKAQSKEKNFCLDSLSANEKAHADKWFAQARTYLKIK